MNTIMLKRARELWCFDYLPYSTQRHNMREWIKAVRMVRDRGNWLLLKKIGKVENVGV